MNSISSILLTGSTGFIGRHLNECLAGKHKLVSLGRNTSNLISWNMGWEPIPPLPAVRHVLHAAGLAHKLPKTKHDSDAFFRVNSEGTKQLLHAMESNPAESFVFLSTVAVYGRNEGEGIDECMSLQPESPYARSKAEAEVLVSAFCKRHGIDYLILRLPLVAGKNPPGNLGAMSKAIQNCRYLRIGSGKARKSMVLAEDIATLVSNWIVDPTSFHTFRPSGTYNLTDGVHPSLHDIENYLLRKWGRNDAFCIPDAAARLLSRVGDVIPGSPFTTQTHHKLTRSLTFSDAKARKDLGWSPRPVLEGDWG